MFPIALFITFQAWVKVIILLYCVTLANDKIKLLIVRLIQYLCSVISILQEPFSETINNYTFYLFSLETQSMGETPLLFSPFLPM